MKAKREIAEAVVGMTITLNLADMANIHGFVHTYDEYVKYTRLYEEWLHQREEDEVYAMDEDQEAAWLAAHPEPEFQCFDPKMMLEQAINFLRRIGCENVDFHSDIFDPLEN